MSPALNDKGLSGVCSTSLSPSCSLVLAASQESFFSDTQAQVFCLETFFHFSQRKLNLKNLLISAVDIHEYEFDYEYEWLTVN
jgi:hypothetical protein